MNLIEKISALTISTAPSVTAKGVGANAQATLYENILNWSVGAGALVAFIFLIVAGFLYLTAGGNAEQAKKGLQGVLNAVIGLIIIMLAWVILNAIIGLLGGTAGTNA